MGNFVPLSTKDFDPFLPSALIDNFNQQIISLSKLISALFGCQSSNSKRSVGAGLGGVSQERWGQKGGGDFRQFQQYFKYKHKMLQQFFRRKFPYGFLVIISCIIVYLYVCFVKLMIIDLSNWHQASVVIFLIIYHIIFVLLLWSVISTITTDPGKVPVQWGFTMTQHERKYCLICHVFKPQRTHHCGTCNRCVLNMDHHCPWVNSCIGFYNRKAFILMLFYTTVITIINIFATALCIQPIIEAIKSQTPGVAPRLVFIIFAFILNCVIFVAILNFLKFHLNLIFSNYTTLEILDLKRQGKGEDPPDSKYDMGSYYNWMQVFGRNWVTWLIPMFRSSEGPSGDGVIWPRASIDNERISP